MNASNDSALERTFIVTLRLLMAWTFLYAASHQVFEPKFSVAGFLSHTKTFHDVFSVFTNPTIAPIATVLVAYGHLLIGLSLLTGLMVRVSASFGVALLLMYWMAHMDFPYIENASNFIVDYHIVYSVVLLYLGEARRSRLGPRRLDRAPAAARQISEPAAAGCLTGTGQVLPAHTRLPTPVERKHRRRGGSRKGAALYGFREAPPPWRRPPRAGRDRERPG